MTREGGSVRVLHVDDEKDLCEMAAIYLERANDEFDVVTETSASDGLDRIETESIDCIVSDHDMPGMDGLDFLRAVRERDEELPFILYTGKGSEEIASEAISAGVTDYLQKGTTSDQYDLLANRIERGVAEVRANEALAESERMFSTLVANLPGMVYRCRNERGWPMEFVSEGAAALTGYDAEAIEGGSIDWETDVMYEGDREDVWEQVQLALDAGEPFEVTYRIETSEGERRWVWERGRMIEGSDEDAAVIEGFITDITARRTRERELEAQREFTQTVVDSLEDMFVVANADGTIVRWNDRTQGVTGYSDAEIAAMSAPEFFEDTSYECIVEAGKEALREGSTTFEATLVTADEERIPYEFRLTTVEHRDETRFCGIGRDVRESRRREAELERYETVIDAVGDPMYTLDADGVITFANEALASLTGYGLDELVGQSIEVVMEDSDLERGRNHIVDLLRDESKQYAIFEMDVITCEGERVPCENHIALLPMPDGEFRGTAGVIRDVTTRKERERRLEEFASVVSHDLRNPLEVLAGRVELAKETGDVSHLEDVDRPLDRMHQLIEDLLRLAHSGEGIDDVDSVDLARAAEDAWQSTDADGGTLEVRGSVALDADRERFQALLENLFRNAVEHGPASDQDAPDAIERGDGVKPADGASVDGVVITVGPTDGGFFVADDGVGIPAEKRNTVFERGYTTQEGGTGYGLAIVADVVDAHGWEVQVTESEDGGARFEVVV